MGTSIDVVICTHNRAADLDRVLGSLAAQSGTVGVDWAVTVIDNDSNDRTPDVVAEWRDRGGVPGLRRVLEPRRGLTMARQRGVAETARGWIAFVDDDNMLEPQWVAELGCAIARHPHAGGFGGRVILDWETEPPAYVREFGWCFAAQDHGADDRIVDNLVGAGMVLRRRALIESGWTGGALVADRTGNRLMSGGDVEIAQRVRCAGFELWYVPGCVMKHRIFGSRLSYQYLVRISHGLGAGDALIKALLWDGDPTAFVAETQRTARPAFRRALRATARAMVKGGVRGATVHLAFQLGFRRGLRAIRRMPEPRWAELVGASIRRARPATALAASSELGAPDRKHHD